VNADDVQTLGQGWIAEEALAISLLCALVWESNFDKALVLAVNHSGDSDSTGAITGNIMGCLLGMQGINHKWTDNLELHDVIQRLGIDLFIGYQDTDYWWDKYPGW
jgi:ADP-ribosyl-[dinitrogen reductase] hydrolase